MPSLVCAAVTAIVAGIIAIFAVVETGLVPVSSFRFFSPTPMPSKAYVGPVTVDDVIANIDRLESLVAKLTLERMQEEQDWPPAGVWPPIMVHHTPKPSASTTTEHPPSAWIVEPGFVDYFVWFLRNLAVGFVLVLSELCQHINRWIVENPPVAPPPKVIIKQKDLPTEAELLEQLSSGVRLPQNSDTTTTTSSPPSSPPPSPPSSPPPPSPPASPPSPLPSPPARRRTQSAPPEVSFSLPVPPKPAPAAPSGAVSRLRPEAAPFVPRKDPKAQKWPSTMTPAEMKAKYHQHGTKAPGF
ncbi:MAG: hypothetical protein Q9183_004686 [Haloplaca sp. 2 TL-2023]